MFLRSRSAELLRRVLARIDAPATPAAQPRAARPLRAPSGAARTARRRRPQSGLVRQSASAPGSRKAAMFFDDYPSFYETSETVPSRARLNLRYEAIIAENRDILDGARVLDIASHDGRWSLAALAAGARSVVGIEGRSELVEHSVVNLERYGYGPDQHRFVCGDVHEVLNSEAFDVDVVLCLGFLYHTLRYNELLAGIRRTSARHVIIDTQSRMMMQPEPVVPLFREHVEKQSAAVLDRYSHGESVISGRPNLAAIRMMTDAYGYRVERLADWGGILRDNPDLRGCTDYAKQGRVTIRFVDKDVVA